MGEQKDSTDREQSADSSRRTFLKVAAVVSAILAVGGVASVAKAITNPAPSGSPSSSSTSTNAFPKVKITNISQLQLNTPVTFYYPLDDEPNIIVKLGQKADGGVGPDGDIVAFSQVCQHLGCIYGFEPQGSSPSCNSSYKASGPVGYCCCHGSVYDLLHGAKVIGGPAPRPEPQVTLEVDSSGDIYATGMKPPTIFGHNTGSNDVGYDLQGGTLVS